MRAQLLTLDHLVQLIDPQLYLHLQSADSTNYFFFFRMLLVWYKREFEWVDVLRLWETLWTDYLTSNFHLFVAVAILEKHRDVIMDHLKQFDEVLKYSTFHSSHFHLSQFANILNQPVNELSNTMDLLPILARAESLFHRFCRSVEAIDKKDNFPTPSAQQRKPIQSQPQSPSNANKGKAPERSSASASGVSTGRPSSSKLRPGDKEPNTKIISPELRELLRKDIFWNDHNPDPTADSKPDENPQSESA